MELTGKSGLRSARRYQHMREACGLALLGTGGLFAVILGILWTTGSKPSTPSGYVVLSLSVAGMLFVGWRFSFEPVHLRCTNSQCGKSINSREPWRCGWCGHDHPTVTTCAFSFIGRCRQCDRKPDAYKCHFCETLLYLTKEEDGRAPAQSLLSQSTSTPVDTYQDVQTLRAREIDDLQHTTRVLEEKKKQRELEREQIRIEIDIVRVKKSQEPSTSAHQTRINRMADRIEEAKATCRSIKDVATQKALALAEIDADPNCPTEAKNDLKIVVGNYFEAIEQDLMRTIPLY